MADGLPATSDFAARVATFAPGSQVPSATLNTWQDNTVALSETVDQTRLAMFLGRVGTANLTDSPAPASYGGRMVWCYKVTTGTTEVVLDTAIDWRDRWIELSIKFFDVGIAPGDVGDDALNGEADYPSEFFYSQAGQDGTAPGPLSLVTFFGEGLKIYARDTDGALCMVRNNTVVDEKIVLIHASCSPQLNQI